MLMYLPGALAYFFVDFEVFAFLTFLEIKGGRVRDFCFIIINFRASKEFTVEQTGQFPAEIVNR